MHSRISVAKWLLVQAKDNVGMHVRTGNTATWAGRGLSSCAHRPRS